MRGYFFRYLGLIFLFYCSGCSPGPVVYESPFDENISVLLEEGKEYYVCIEYKKQGASFLIPSCSSGGREYVPIIRNVVAVYDRKGNTIPNVIQKIHSYYWIGFGYGKAGITVARFKLEGTNPQKIIIKVNEIAYKEFAVNGRLKMGHSGS